MQLRDDFRVFLELDCDLAVRVFAEADIAHEREHVLGEPAVQDLLHEEFESWARGEAASKLLVEEG